MNVIQVVPRIAEEASGPSYSVPRLADALGRRGVEVDLHALDPVPAASGRYRVHGHPAGPVLDRLGISSDLQQALRQAAGRADLLHNHSLWMLPNVYPGWAVRGTPCRLVTSPRGTLAPWALKRSRWRKRLLWLLGQGRAVRASHCFHATSAEECRHVRALGLRAPVAVIPNGIDIPPERPCPAGPPGRRRLLFLGRIHPVKGVDVLLRAWQQVQQRLPDWELRIVGPDDGGHLGRMRELAASLAAERVVFAGPAYGPDKATEYERADAFILPSHTENFGMAVAEALAHGVPAVVTRGAPWAGLADHGCGWWVEQGVGPVADCLATVLGHSQERLYEMGRRGRLWMQREFSWERVGEMMHVTYSWLLGGGPAPAWVVHD